MRTEGGQVEAGEEEHMEKQGGGEEQQVELLGV